MNRTILKNVPFQLVVLTIITLASVHFYEIGYCRYFAIPIEFISIELREYGYMIFAFIASVALYIIMFDVFIYYLMSALKIRSKYKRVVLIILFLIFFGFWISHYVWRMPSEVLFTLIFTLIFGFILIFNKSKPAAEEEKYSTVQYISKQLGEILGPVLINSIIVCFISFSLGYEDAKSKISFFAKPDNKTVLLKRYGATLIYGVVENGKIRQILVEQNLSKIDTLKIIKISQ